MSNGRGKSGMVGGPEDSIPARMRETVQSLKEIVNCTEQEIYAMLKECNMDPNEAVHRLLTQGNFHEVKSKREKKKETKWTAAESRSQRVNSNSSGRGIRGGTDRAGLNSSSEISSDDYGATHKNGASIAPNSSNLGSGAAANNSNWSVMPLSNYDSIGNTTQAPGPSDSISSPSQPSSIFQHNWLGVPGQLSMADIVKMGRPQRKPSSTPSVAAEMSNSCSSPNALTSNTSQDSARCFSTTVLPSESTQELYSSQDRVSKVTEICHDLSIGVGQHKSLDEWPLVDQSPEGSGPIVSDTSAASAIYPDRPASSSLHVDGTDLHLSPHVHDIRKSERNVNEKNLPTESSISDGQINVDNSDRDSCLDDGSFKNTNSYQSERRLYERFEVLSAQDVHKELSSDDDNLQQLSLHEEQGATSGEENPAVIIPGHLQVTNADCSHLSFGSFGSGVGASFPGAFTSNLLKSNSELTSVPENASPIDHSDARKPECYNNEQLRITTDDNVAPRTGTSSGNYDMASAAQLEVIRDDTFDAAHKLQYNISSVSGYAFSSTTQPNAATCTHAQANSQMQNLAPFSSLMQPYTNGVPGNLLAGTAPTVRELDLPFLPLLANQSMPTKYSTSMSSLSVPTISMPEALKPGLFSNLQPTPQTISGTTLSTGPALPQHIPSSPHAQPILPLGPLANMVSYPFLPQSITNMPFSSSSAFHQSQAALQSAGMKYAHPQFKSSIPSNSLPPSLPVAPGYGGFRSSTNIPGTFMQNPSTAAASMAAAYEEALRSHYKEGDHFIPLRQSENSLMWPHEAGSRKLPAVPASTYYDFQRQIQQGGGVHRHGQLPTRMGMAGYPNRNLYHSQVGGVSREHQQHPSLRKLNGSQGQPSQETHQLWEHSH